MNSGFGLTVPQYECLCVIQELMEGGPVAPSCSEIAAEMGIGRSAVHRLIGALEERGFLRRLPHRARAIEVVRPVPLPDFTPFAWSLGPGLPAVTA